MFILMKHKIAFLLPAALIPPLQWKVLTFSSLERYSHIGMADELHSLAQSAITVSSTITFAFMIKFVVFLELLMLRRLFFFWRKLDSRTVSLISWICRALGFASIRQQARLLCSIFESKVTKKMLCCASFIYWNSMWSSTVGISSHYTRTFSRSTGCLWIFLGIRRCVDSVTSFWTIMMEHFSCCFRVCRQTSPHVINTKNG